MKNLSTHRTSYLRALYLVETELALATSVARESREPRAFKVADISFSASELAWFSAPIKGGK